MLCSQQTHCAAGLALPSCYHALGRVESLGSCGSSAGCMLVRKDGLLESASATQAFFLSVQAGPWHVGPVPATKAGMGSPAACAACTPNQARPCVPPPGCRPYWLDGWDHRTVHNSLSLEVGAAGASSGPAWPGLEKALKKSMTAVCDSLSMLPVPQQPPHASLCSI